MIRLLILNFCLSLCFSVSGQKSFNFFSKNRLLEFNLNEPNNGHNSWQMCDSTSKVCTSSDKLLWPFQEDVFVKEFLSNLKKVDSTSEALPDSEKNALANKVFEWTKTQYNSEIIKPTDQIKKALEDNGEKTKVGVLILQKDEFKTSKDLRKVTLINGSIEDGSIKRRALIVTLDDGSTYFNKETPINFPKYFNRKRDSLNLWTGKGADKIKLGDVLDYHFINKIYYPADCNFLLTPEKGYDTDTLLVGSDLNNMIEMNIFSDLLGLIGNKPNGLIQTEISGNFISNTASLKHLDIIFHNFMKPYFRLVRIDSKFRSLDSSNLKIGSKGDTLDRTYMSQISYLQAGLKINVAKVGFGINQTGQLNIGGDVNLTNADSIYKKDITFFNYYTEIYYEITKLKNFGMDISLRWILQYLSTANQDEFHIVNRGAEHFFNPTFGLYYYPTGNVSSKIYFRFSYMSNPVNGNSNYTQFQVGYKTALKLN